MITTKHVIFSSQSQGTNGIFYKVIIYLIIPDKLSHRSGSN